MKTIDYNLQIKVTLNYLRPPKDIVEKIKRQQIQNQIDMLVFKYIDDVRNRQNLMNAILGNTNLII